MSTRFFVTAKKPFGNKGVNWDVLIVSHRQLAEIGIESERTKFTTAL